LLVDPSGLLPVYHLTTPDHDLYASDPCLFARSGMPEPPVSYLALHAHLLKPELRRRVTCLEGVDELAPGVLHFPGMPEGPPQAIWHATDFLPSGEILDFEEYADQLKGLSTAVIHCWSESLGMASVSASGGVDSSLICAALTHAEQRFDCVTLATLDPTGDERIYARRVADWFDVRCAERVYDPALYDPNRSASEGLPRPARRSFQQVLDTLLLDAMTELGASTIYDGNGGTPPHRWSTGWPRRVSAQVRAAPLSTCAALPAARSQAWAQPHFAGILANAGRKPGATIPAFWSL
jgi:asparagine synthase (glutamine-hydrolysing)